MRSRALSVSFLQANRAAAHGARTTGRDWVSWRPPMTTIRILALVLALSACTDGAPSTGTSPSPSPSKPPVVALLANGLDLRPGEPVVLAIDPAAPAAGVIVTHDPTSRIDVHLLQGAADPLPGECPLEVGVRRNKTCIAAIGTGVRESLEQTGRAGGVAVVLRSGPGRIDVRVEYDERSRRVGLRLPRLAPPAGASVCKDNGCNPFLEVMPLRGGTLTATAIFTGGPGRLQIQSGRVIAKSFTASGLPYRIPDEDVGASPLRVTTRLDAPAEYALAFMSEDRSDAITGIVIDATWP